MLSRYNPITYVCTGGASTGPPERPLPLETAMKRSLPPEPSGLTLVELVIVVLIIGILVSVGIPRVPAIHLRARISAAASSVRIIQDAIDLRRVQTREVPPTVDPAWFRGRRFPGNPFAPDPAVIVRVSSTGDPAKVHPKGKAYVAGGSADSAYWYNSTNGIVRARVAKQKTKSETLALYNEVNNTAATTMSQTTE